MVNEQSVFESLRFLCYVLSVDVYVGSYFFSVLEADSDLQLYYFLNFLIILLAANQTILKSWRISSLLKVNTFQSDAVIKIQTQLFK